MTSNHYIQQQPGNCKLSLSRTLFSYPPLFNCCSCFLQVYEMRAVWNLGCCRSCQQNIIWHLHLKLLWTLWPWTGSSSLFGSEPMEGGIVCLETAAGNVQKRFAWCYPRSKMDRGWRYSFSGSALAHSGVWVWVCVGLTGGALFLSLSLFICDLSASARQKGQAGHFHCSLLCVSLAECAVSLCVCARL